MSDRNDWPKSEGMSPTIIEGTAEIRVGDDPMFGSRDDGTPAPPPPLTKKYVTSEQVKKARDFKTADVDMTPYGWGGWVCLKALTGKERDAFETSLRIKKNGKADVSTINMRAKLVVLCAIDNPIDQNRLWSDQDAEWLGNKSSAAISKLYDEASELSGFTESDTEDLEGNSSDARTGNSK